MRLNVSLVLLIMFSLTYCGGESTKKTNKADKTEATPIQAGDRVMVDRSGNLIVLENNQQTNQKPCYEVVVAPDNTLEVKEVSRNQTSQYMSNCAPNCAPTRSLGRNYQNPVDKINSLEDVYFAQGESTLTLESMQTLDKYIEILKMYPYINVSITGWADYTGDDKINDPLSTKRAEAVKDYLVKNSIANERIVYGGSGVYNKENPLKDPEGMRKSRVADISVKF